MPGVTKGTETLKKLKINKISGWETDNNMIINGEIFNFSKVMLTVVVLVNIATKCW